MGFEQITNTQSVTENIASRIITWSEKNRPKKKLIWLPQKYKTSVLKKILHYFPPFSL